MDRRGFLGTILALGIAPAIVRASSLMPIKVIDAPRIITFGDVAAEFWKPVAQESGLLTPSMIVNEALKMLEDQLILTRQINQKYALDSLNNIIRIRMPQ